jgi:hypothetical protein
MAEGLMIHGGGTTGPDGLESRSVRGGHDDPQATAQITHGLQTHRPIGSDEIQPDGVGQGDLDGRQGAIERASQSGGLGASHRVQTRHDGSQVATIVRAKRLDESCLCLLGHGSSKLASLMRTRV